VELPLVLERVEGLRGPARILPAAVPARFDIASWDPRGVGASTAVRCLPTAADEMRFLDGMVPGESLPVGRAEMDRWIERYGMFDRLCAGRNRSLVRHVSTADTARLTCCAPRWAIAG